MMTSNPNETEHVKQERECGVSSLKFLPTHSLAAPE